MRKFFLISLLTLCSCVMAWSATRTAGTFAELQDALSAAANGDVIELTADITYPTNGVGIININKSITLDGKGHTIWGLGKAQLHVSGSGQNHYAVIAVNENQFGSTAELDVTIKNLALGNISRTEKNPAGDAKAIVSARCYGIVAYDGVKYLTLENDSIKTGLIQSGNKWVGPSNQQPLCLTGTQSEAIVLTINNSFISSGNGAYPMYVLKPITATLTNVTTEGWCAMYFKYRYSLAGTAYATYGDVAGTRGSVVTANNCAFNAPNIHAGQTNGFAVFPIEDDGLTLTLNNCSMNAERFTDQAQMVISLQYNSRPTDDENIAPVIVNINGDNTHLYNVELNRFALSGWNTDDDEHPTTYTPYYKDAPLHMNITGGTFTVNPSQIKFRNWNNEGTEIVWEYAYIDPSVYEVKEVSQSGNTVYRVVKKAQEKTPGVMYNLNDFVPVEGEGYGDNPVSSFDLSTGTEMTLNQATTTAGYVQVKDNATEGATTVTVGKATQDQTLVINNGLDVQGNSVVEVQSGSALVIGEGGIVTSKPENIVIEANENGAASLLLDPAITVNQTPELTVKMTVPAEHAGYEMLGGDQYRHWFRFAMPVQHMAATWAKEPNVATYLYGWDYANQKWSQVGVTEMVPFAGYTLSPDREITNLTGAITYTFKGQLLGNTDCKLELNHHGYNFFGNSYTGYISILKLVEQIMGDSKIDGTVWMWDGEKYEGVALANLSQRPGLYYSWQKEVAPMQTFVLRLAGEEFASTEVNYEDAIWGNPRYTTAVSAINAAPARKVEMNDNAVIRMNISANNQSESILFIENNDFSDEYNRGYDAIKYMNENCFNSYVSINGENYSTVATDNLEGKTLSFRTKDELAYTLTFDIVAGNEYAIRDNATGAVFAIEEGASYEFAAQPNSTVEGRFEIINVNKMPTAVENTEVKANVKGIYTIMGQYLGEDFDILPAGVYVVDGVKIVK